MTFDEAKEQIPTFEDFRKYACNSCDNEWYCPTLCDVLEKAKKLDYSLVIKCFARHDGDMRKVFRYIKNTNRRH